MADDIPNLVTSGSSQTVIIGGYSFSIEIYRLENEAKWTLEVVDEDGMSHVWDKTFKSDNVARKIAIKEIETEGPRTFMRGNNIIPFA